MRFLCYLRLHKKIPVLENYTDGDILVTRAFITCQRCKCFIGGCDIEQWDMKKKQRQPFASNWLSITNEKAYCIRFEIKS